MLVCASKCFSSNGQQTSGSRGEKGKKSHFNDRVTEEMNHEQAEIAKKQKGSIEDCFQTSASILADRKVANYVYVTN